MIVIPMTMGRSKRLLIFASEILPNKLFNGASYRFEDPRSFRKRFVTFVMNTYAPVVLAAGKGTRMRSTLPKVSPNPRGLGLPTSSGLPVSARKRPK